MGKAKRTLVERILTPYFFAKNLIRRELLRRDIRKSIRKDLKVTRNSKGNTLKKNPY